MLELACDELNSDSDGTRFEASRLEEGDGKSPSYSIDTIAKLRAHQRPEDELFFIIGADAFADLRTWHRWRDVARAIRFIIVTRPGYFYDAPPEAKVEGVVSLDEPVSSSEIRRRLAAREDTPRPQGAPLLDAPRAVMEYIHSHGLYANG